MENVLRACQKACQNQNEFIAGLCKLIVVHDDVNMLNTFRNIASTNQSFGPELRVFDQVHACHEFIASKISDDGHPIFVVFVGGQLVCDLISCIHGYQQVQSILILNKPPLTKDEREMMQRYPKVQSAAESQIQTGYEGPSSPLNIKVIQKSAFTEPIVFTYTDGQQDDSDINECVEPQERSFKQYDSNFIFRYSMLLCLLHAKPYPSSRDDLINLLLKENLASPIDINKFIDTYSPEQAVHFYSRDPFIYHNLNSALRTSNFRHLFLFRFILQDICRQLRELMVQEPNNDVLTLYRGQICGPYEIADLTCAYNKGSPFTINSFFSTSKSRSVSLSFLYSTGATLCDGKRLPTLFKIVIQKADASHFLPCADISRFSQFPEEEEVLFAPGQMFTINHFDIIFDKGLNIYTFEIALKRGFNEDVNRVHTKIEKVWNTQVNDPFFYIGILLLEDKRFQEAKEFYMELLSQNLDDSKKYVCYQQLMIIAQMQNNTHEMKIMQEKMNEIKFGNTASLNISDHIPLDRRDYSNLNDNMAQIQNMIESFSDQSIMDLSNDIENGDFSNRLEQLNDLVYNMASTMINNNAYPIAIQYIESMLNISEPVGFIPLKPSLRAKFYVRLGYCYRELKLNDKSLKYYKLASEEKAHLPPEEYIKVMLSIGKILEAINRYEEALHNYIQLTEDYDNNSNLGGPDERHEVEECLKRVTSYFVSTD